MQVGVRIPGSGSNASPENIARVARWAEELGFASVWAPDHVVMPETVQSSYPYVADGRWPYPPHRKWFDPLLALAWAGAAAPSVQLGTSVLIAPLRNPVLLAKQVASLDNLTGGRVLLGIGAGWMKEEFDLLGVPFAGRGRRTVAMVRLMRALWRGERASVEGELAHTSGGQMQPRPAQPTVPVLWGGNNDLTLRRVAREGDGWHPSRLSTAELAAGIQRLHHHCEVYGRDPAAVSVAVNPGRPITAELVAEYRELKVNHVTAWPSLEAPDMNTCLEEMQRVAEVCGLKARK